MCSCCEHEEKKKLIHFARWEPNYFPIHSQIRNCPVKGRSKQIQGCRSRPMHRAMSALSIFCLEFQICKQHGLWYIQFSLIWRCCLRKHRVGEGDAGAQGKIVGGRDRGRRDIYLEWRESKKIEVQRCRPCADSELSVGQTILFEEMENELFYFIFIF